MRGRNAAFTTAMPLARSGKGSVDSTEPFPSLTLLAQDGATRLRVGVEGTPDLRGLGERATKGVVEHHLVQATRHLKGVFLGEDSTDALAAARVPHDVVHDTILPEQRGLYKAESAHAHTLLGEMGARTSAHLPFRYRS